LGIMKKMGYVGKLAAVLIEILKKGSRADKFNPLKRPKTRTLTYKNTRNQN